MAPRRFIGSRFMSTSSEPISPLAADEAFTFACHPNVSCFNHCCRDLHQALSPYDVLRLKQALSMTSVEFLSQYTSRHIGPQSGLPIVTLRPRQDEAKTCPFVTPTGCSVYHHRPASCRIYPLARGVTPNAQGNGVTEQFALIREPHCRGFLCCEAPSFTPSQWIADQQIDPYFRMNDRLLGLIQLKNQSIAGPLDLKSQHAFYTALYDLETFRTHLFNKESEPDLEGLDITTEIIRTARQNDSALLEIAHHWIAHTLFGFGDVL